jgi:hypothetical protein
MGDGKKSERLHSYPVIFQKADIFAMFEREKIDF